MNHLSKWQKFKANRRAFCSLVLFAALCIASLFAPFIANDRPIFIYKDAQAFFPIFVNYTESELGASSQKISPQKAPPNTNTLLSHADYADPFVQDLLKGALIINPPIPYRYDSIIWDLDAPSPLPPSAKHILGTDDKSRDVAARLLYGYRISIAFGLLLSVFSVGVGVLFGALQGYYGGWVDLAGQRAIEVLNSVPILFLIIIISSMLGQSFWWILAIVLLFSWMGLVGLVRAEFLKARAMEYVKSAKILGLSDTAIMFRHILPNALSATITYAPFIMAGSIATLSSLDFLGLGLPVGSASLGELLKQGKDNLNAPHLGITAFLSVAFLLSLLVFIGEGVRDVFDVRGAHKGAYNSSQSAHKKAA